MFRYSHPRPVVLISGGDYSPPDSRRPGSLEVPQLGQVARPVQDPRVDDGPCDAQADGVEGAGPGGICFPAEKIQLWDRHRVAG